MPETLLDEREPWCDEANAFLCCSGKENPCPSCNVTTRMPGLGGLMTGAWTIASEAAGGLRVSDAPFRAFCTGTRRRGKTRLTNRALRGWSGGAGRRLLLRLFVLVRDGRGGRGSRKGAQRPQMGVLELCDHVSQLSIWAKGDRRWQPLAGLATSDKQAVSHQTRRHGRTNSW